VDGRVGVQEEAEHLVADGVAGDLGPDLLDDAGVVAAADGGKLVLEPICVSIPAAIPLSAGLTEGGVHAHEHLLRRGCGRRQVVAQSGRRVERVEGDCFHCSRSFRCRLSC
jgi:hypothetical protein